MEEQRPVTTEERRLNARQANQLAQQIDDEAEGRGSAEEASEIQTENRPPGHQEANRSKPLEGVERGALAQVFPPDIAPSTDVGGSPEERGALEEEYKR